VCKIHVCEYYFPPTKNQAKIPIPVHSEKLSLEIFETQDLSSPNGKPKILFYDYSWHFFSPANRRGELCCTSET
jgi:hypothetical protein